MNEYVSNDALVSISVCTALLVVLKPIYTGIFTPIFRSLGVLEAKSLRKCLNDFWICLLHSAMLVTMLGVTIQKDFFWAINPLSGDEMRILNTTPSPEFYTLEMWTFALQVAFLVADIFFAHWETHPDRLEKTIHHVTTVFLIMTGLAVHFHHSAMVVMLIHKVAEPVLFLGKTAVTLKWDKLSTAFFVFFVLVWIPSRLMLFPAWIYLVATTPLPWSDLTRDITSFFCALLMCLHLHWTYQIYQVLLAVLNKQKITQEMDNAYQKDDAKPNNSSDTATAKKTQ